MSTIDFTDLWCLKCITPKTNCTCEKSNSLTGMVLYQAPTCSGCHQILCTCCKSCGVPKSRCSCCKTCGQSWLYCSCCKECGNQKYLCTCEVLRQVSITLSTCSGCYKPKSSCTCCKACGMVACICSRFSSIQPSWTPTVFTTSPETELARRSPRRAESLLRRQSENCTLVDLANSSTATEFARQGRGTKYTIRHRFLGIPIGSTEYGIEPI